MTTYMDVETPKADGQLAERIERTRQAALDAATQLRQGARDRLQTAGHSASQVAGMTGHQMTVAGRQAAATLQRHPVATALAVVGIGIGVALLLSSRTRGAALAAALPMWKAVRSRI